MLSDDIDLLMTHCKTLRGKGWDIVLIHVIDQAELTPDLMFAGDDRSQPTTLIDSETGNRIMVLSSPAALQRYRQAAEAWLADLTSQCRMHGITYVQLATDQPVETAVLRLLNERGLLR